MVEPHRITRTYDSAERFTGAFLRAWLAWVNINATRCEEERTPEDVKRFLHQYCEAFPDLEIAVEDQIAEGDKVVTRWASRGTHRGEFRGIGPHR